MKPIPIKPGSGQESVWNYPRPPRVKDCSKNIRIIFNDIVIVDTHRSRRVLETSHPPVYYVPIDDIHNCQLIEMSKTSWCEWKGLTIYYTLVERDKRIEEAAWSYPEPTQGFLSIKNYVAFYAQKMDACFVNEEKVKPQPGCFYGGWITNDVVGPFKGEPGSQWW